MKTKTQIKTPLEYVDDILDACDINSTEFFLIIQYTRRLNKEPVTLCKLALNHACKRAGFTSFADILFCGWEDDEFKLDCLLSPPAAAQVLYAVNPHERNDAWDYLLNTFGR